MSGETWVSAIKFAWRHDPKLDGWKTEVALFQEEWDRLALVAARAMLHRFLELETTLADPPRKTPE